MEFSPISRRRWPVRFPARPRDPGDRRGTGRRHGVSPIAAGAAFPNSMRPLHCHATPRGGVHGAPAGTGPWRACAHDVMYIHFMVELECSCCFSASPVFFRSVIGVFLPPCGTGTGCGDEGRARRIATLDPFADVCGNLWIALADPRSLGG